MIKSQDIKIGTCIRLDGKLFFCIDFLHVKPGKGNTFMRTKLKSVVDGRERRSYQFSYAEGDMMHLLNQETWDDVAIAKDMITGVDYMKEGDVLEVVKDASTDTILFAEMPVKTILKVVYTEPGLKGDTATNTLKPAKVETGVEVKVPLFINEGELIEVDTRDGSYVNRVKA